MNPSHNAQDFLHGSVDGENELKFTENVVCIDIVGPDVGFLTLVDLPGLIKSTELDQDAYTITLMSVLIL